MDFPPAMLASAPNPQVRSPFLKELISSSSTSTPPPSLGRFVYQGDQWILPSEVGEQGRILMTPSTETGLGGAGGRVEVFIASAFLGNGWSVKGEDTHEGGGLGGGGEGWKGLLERLSEERRFWGTEVYTDDSDLVGVLVHSGWVVPRFTSVASMYGGGGEGEVGRKDKGGGVRVTLRMVGRLIRYVSTERNGVRSRGWGNGHDGGSLVVESVVRVEASEKQVSMSRRTKKTRLARFAEMRKELVDEANDDVLNLTVFGDAGYKFSPSALYDVFNIDEFPSLPSDEEVARYGSTPPSDGLRDFDLYLENPDECYRLHLLSPSSSSSTTPHDPQLTVTILPVRPSAVQPSASSSSSGTPPDAPDLLLGKVPVSPWDLEWVEGGLILREPGEGGEKGWFCRVERYWWTRREEDEVVVKERVIGLGFEEAEEGGEAPAPASVVPVAVAVAVEAVMVVEEAAAAVVAAEEGEKDVVMV
ncbi:histone deacetylation protein Rxt3-domain-containing protein [Mrakia frigida]|uniref:histone deacetylation protein Rxt3-domain-containing protein n=1 Tax=Mrakia frigida TaxID=29902 RepID=UPI003FCBFB71